MKGLQHIFITPELNKKVFNILSKMVDNVDTNKGRKRMSLWEILVLAVIKEQFRYKLRQAAKILFLPLIKIKRTDTVQ